MKWSNVILPTILNKGLELAGIANFERQKGEHIYPPKEQVFRALELTTPDKVKVVIVGQDPYHSPGAANGLAFSVNPDRPLQPSLKNIFKELTEDLGIEYPKTGDLTPWAEKGVLLLNTTLTVYEGKPNSCASWGWSSFTQGVLRAISQLPQPVVYLLWGANAHSLLSKLITSNVIYPNKNIHMSIEEAKKKAYVLSSHPSPLSYSKTCRGAPSFKGSKPFSTTNNLLKQMGAEPVDWRL